MDIFWKAVLSVLISIVCITGFILLLYIFTVSDIAEIVFFCVLGLAVICAMSYAVYLELFE